MADSRTSSEIISPESRQLGWHGLITLNFAERVPLVLDAGERLPGTRRLFVALLADKAKSGGHVFELQAAILKRPDRGYDDLLALIRAKNSH